MSYIDHHGYQELRALVEELLGSPVELRDGFHAALTVWLALHCRDCGALIDRELRERSEFCIVCFTPPDLDATSTTGGWPVVPPDDIPF